MKYHMIHDHWRFSFPAGHAKRLAPEQTVQWLWWTDAFEAEEVTIHGVDAQERELERFVAAVRPCPAWQLALDRRLRQVRSLAGRAVGKLGRAFS